MTTEMTPLAERVVVSQGLRWQSGGLYTIFSLALWGIVGCGSAEQTTIPVYRTQGRLLTEKGEPAAGATVSFHPIGRAEALPFVPHGQAGADGAFELTSYALGDGAPSGEYAVTITWRTNSAEGDPIGPDRLKGKYADPKKPLAQVSVRAGENKLEPFHLK